MKGIVHLVAMRKPPDSKPLMILGQDEVIFKQYLMNSQVWTALDGTTPLVPKDDGRSLMISAGFTSRELGYGCH